MTNFDAKKALCEEMEGLSSIVTTISNLRARSERVMAEAEMEHNALLKLEAFARGEHGRKQRALREIEKNEEETR